MPPNISRNTFDVTKNYDKLLEQQGVPVLDADLNEMQDILRQRIQLIIRHGVGNGSADNGFLCVGTGANNNFTLKAGSIFASGYWVEKTIDETYNVQVDYTSPPPLAAPGVGTRTDLVYLHVSEIIIDSTVDANIKDPTLMVETCQRIKIQAQVKVAPGGTLPPDTSTDFYSPLASITRTAGQLAINIGDITDLRGNLTEPVANLFAEVSAARGASANLAARLSVISAIGSANQLLGTNAGASASEYKTLQGTTNQIVVTNGSGLITLSTPQNLDVTATPTFGSLSVVTGSLLLLLRQLAGVNRIDSYNFPTTIAEPLTIDSSLLTLEILDTVKAILSGSALTMSVPIAMGTNKITGLTQGSATGEAIAYPVTGSQMTAGTVTATQIAAATITAGLIASGQVVKTLNGLADTVTIAGISNVNVNVAGSTITIDARGKIGTVATSSGTLYVDASTASQFNITLGGNIIIAGPTNGIDGQKIVLRFIQDGSGGRVVTFPGGAGNYEYSPSVPSLTLSTAAFKVDYVGIIWNAARNMWDVVAFMAGF